MKGLLKLKIYLYTKLIGLLGWVEAFGILCILLAAIFLQYYLHELPCPLCSLQRVGMLLIATALFFNLRIKRKIAHYMMANLAGLLTAVIALRQILLHINDPIGQGYGDMLLGYHLYTWVFIFSLLVIIYNSFTSCFLLQFFHKPLYYQGKLGRCMVVGLMYLLLLVAILNAIGIYLECGLSQCPDNPVTYKIFMLNHKN